MLLFYFSILLTILSNVFYHIFQKLTPTNVNPFLALAVSYGSATLMCLAFLPFFPPAGGLVVALKQLNWVSVGLAASIVGLELGFLLAYRAGWNISLAGLVSNLTVSLLLLPIGLAFFKERLTPVNLIGIVVCIVGLVMVNHK